MQFIFLRIVELKRAARSRRERIEKRRSDRSAARPRECRRGRRFGRNCPCLSALYGKWLKMKLPIRFFVFGLAGLLAFASCNQPAQAPRVAGPADSASPLPATEAWITATPNPIPGVTGQGKTTIKWHSGGSTGVVYVGGTDSIFASAPDGSQDASWIDLSSTTEFLLYTGEDRKTLLARVSVTGSQQ
jgi:hypothetical protein